MQIYRHTNMFWVNVVICTFRIAISESDKYIVAYGLLDNSRCDQSDISQDMQLTQAWNYLFNRQGAFPLHARGCGWGLSNRLPTQMSLCHDDVIKWKHLPRHWPFVRGIHRSQVNSPHKGQWRGALMFSLICARIIYWVNNGEAGDLRRQHAHYDVISMPLDIHVTQSRLTGRASCTVEVWKWISNSVLYFIMGMITYPCWH